MKNIHKLAVSGTLLLLLPFVAHGSTSDEESLKSLERSWVAATAGSDMATVGKILDDSFVETMPNGAHRSKQEVLSAPAPAPGSSQSLEDLEVRVTGDVAVVTGVNHYTPTPGADPVDFRFTDTYTRHPDGWRAISAVIWRKPANGE
jgi:ketosteroid isomerase-like protein